MNVAHHSVYPVWLEMARTELLRQRGRTYRDLEAAGVFLVVAKLAIRYRRPALYDDQLTVQVTSLPTAGVKLEHTYIIRRGVDTHGQGSEVIAKADTTLACVDRDGKLRPVPRDILSAASGNADS